MMRRYLSSGVKHFNRMLEKESTTLNEFRFIGQKLVDYRNVTFHEITLIIDKHTRVINELRNISENASTSIVKKWAINQFHHRQSLQNNLYRWQRHLSNN